MFFNRDAKRVRYQVTGWSQGTPQKSSTETDIEISVNEPTSYEMSLLPEGNRKDGVLKISTGADLRTSDGKKGNKTVADDIKYDGETYQVEKIIGNYDQFLPHTEALVKRKEE